MNFLRDLNLRHKLVIAMFVPLLGLLWFGQSELRGATSAKAESERLLELADLSVTVSAMVHELQKERGMSAGYLGSVGQRFSSELPQQHKAADTRISALRTLLKSFDAAQFGSNFVARLSLGLQSLDDIDNQRQGILALRVSVVDGIGYYTATNKAFLDLVGNIPKLSSDGAVANAGAAYSAFLQSKERAGIERAVLANVFAKDRFEAGMFQRFSTLLIVQDIYFDQFRALASETNLAAFESAMADPKVNKTDAFREIAIEKATSGGFGVDPTEWFAAQTQKIELLKSVEDQLSSALHVQGTDNIEAASADLMLAIAIVAASLISALAITWFIISDTLALLGAEPIRLREVMDAIASGNLEEDLQSENAATGVFAAAQTMQINLRERAERDRRIMAENGRIRQALNNVDGHVLIANSDAQIVYANDAIIGLLGSLEGRLRQLMPEFSSKDVQSFDFDILHMDCAFDSSMLTRLKDSTRDEMELAGLTIAVAANPVFSEDGERLGTVVEWHDRTAEIATEREVGDVVQRALDGDLTPRIDLSGKKGFFATLAERVNRLLDVSEEVVGDTARVFSAVANGDLTKTIDTEYNGAYQALKQDANATVATLTEVVTNIQAASNSVRTGAGEISDGNADLSSRTEQQASSLEETASSMEEMTSSVRQNADNAAQANELAIEARDQAQKGGEVVDAAVHAMSEINDSSRKISDIIGVINEIAFQTNLLALNASVEAARAGDQGRGFAVVASEVRNLAGRSATAAKEIKDLIEDSGRKVEDGARLVNESGQTLTDIVAGVGKVTDIVGEIAAASREQSAGIEQVNTAISQMDELTQQNAALVEEAAAASESLSSQADDLNLSIKFFHVSDSAATSNDVGSVPANTTERRAENRPWSGDSKEEAPLAFGQAATAVATSNGADVEWEEF